MPHEAKPSGTLFCSERNGVWVIIPLSAKGLLLLSHGQTEEEKEDFALRRLARCARRVRATPVPGSS